MPIGGWPEERAREVEISVGADPVLPTRFRIGPAGAAPRGPSDSRAGQHTPIIEPLSLDEAYLDVTENLKAISSATQIAEEIRARIRAERVPMARQRVSATAARCPPEDWPPTPFFNRNRGAHANLT
jgi:hypothetical protein